MGDTPERAMADPNPQAVVLFDGQCPLCQRAVRLLKRLDWLKRLQFRDCRDTANLPPCATPLDPKRLLEEMHLVTPDRKRAYAGYRAFRWIAWRLPLTWGLAPLLYVPGVPWLGHKLYLWVARNRYNLVPCKDGVCRVPLRGKEAGARDQKSGKTT
jgi:predicted DCC family thiol-disulfide oxidoreductase YuxK